MGRRFNDLAARARLLERKVACSPPDLTTFTVDEQAYAEAQLASHRLHVDHNLLHGYPHHHPSSAAFAVRREVGGRAYRHARRVHRRAAGLRHPDTLAPSFVQSAAGLRWRPVPGSAKYEGDRQSQPGNPGTPGSPGLRVEAGEFVPAGEAAAVAVTGGLPSDISPPSLGRLGDGDFAGRSAAAVLRAGAAALAGAPPLQSA